MGVPMTFHGNLLTRLLVHLRRFKVAIFLDIQLYKGASSINAPYQSQRKRLAPSPTPPLFEEDDQEEDQEQHSSIPNEENDGSDFVNDDDYVTDDDEDPTSVDQDDRNNTNARTDEFDDGYC
jgi:hypothetical protein